MHPTFQLHRTNCATHSTASCIARDLQAPKGPPENRAAKRARKREEEGGSGAGEAAGAAGDEKKGVEIDPSTYPRTAFISNLQFETDEERLKAVLGGCGTIVEVRLNRKGPKRFAYVQFEAAEAVTEALKLDRNDVDGRLVVWKSTPVHQSDRCSLSVSPYFCLSVFLSLCACFSLLSLSLSLALALSLSRSLEH